MLNNRIKKQRQDMYLTHDAFAEFVGDENVSGKDIEKWETTDSTIPIDWVMKLAEKLKEILSITFHYSEQCSM